MSLHLAVPDVESLFDGLPTLNCLGLTMMQLASTIQSVNSTPVEDIEVGIKLFAPYPLLTFPPC